MSTFLQPHAVSIERVTLHFLEENFSCVWYNQERNVLVQKLATTGYRSKHKISHTVHINRPLRSKHPPLFMTD